ncbi:hypothetical protein, conserved [Eimeria acervulina]|uniref:Uncharacterized protein n=1 Tax=Eimeria acervulina TaxID=5801 RepID=U6GDI2_EIMAC|nr:hypothetical protein, conserved [Eimeria acervulina]CDI78210.1 hypothetical protein, conserved [Eimeria acervulina]
MAATAAPLPRRSLASNSVEAAEGTEQQTLVPPAAETAATSAAAPEVATAAGGTAARHSIVAAGGTPAAAGAAAAVVASVAAQRRFSAAELALSASRRPLFLTFSLLCASDAAALLQQKDNVRLARQLDELLQLHEFVVLLRQPPQRPSLPGPFSCSSSSSNSSSADFAGQLESAEDSGEKDALAVSCSSSSSNSSNRKSIGPAGAAAGRALPLEECREEEAAETHRLSGVDSSLTEAAAVVAAADTPSPTSLDAVSTLKQPQHQQQQQHQQYLEMLRQQEEEATAAAHLVVVEYFVAAVAFSRSSELTPRAVSAFLALLLRVYRQAVQQQLSPAAAFDAFKSLLLQHSVHRPPRSTAVFYPKQLLPAAEFFLQHFVRLLPHLQQLHSPQLKQLLQQLQQPQLVLLQ